VQLVNPELDPAALARRYREARRLVVRDFLAPETAALLAENLAADLPWEFWSRDDSGTRVVAPERYAQLTPAEKQALIPPLPGTGSRDPFRFAYDRVTGGVPQASSQPLRVLSAFQAAVAGPGYLALIQAITGHVAARTVQGHYSCYRRNHFLGPHTDASRDQVRLAAHLIALTPDWDDTWGGQLRFCTPRGEVLDTVTPSFNTLVLFDVPAWHFVTPVTAPPEASRYSFFGWLVERNAVSGSREPTRVER
jgi:SM-20-related protein